MILVSRHWAPPPKRAGLASPPYLTSFSSSTSQEHLSGENFPPGYQIILSAKLSTCIYVLSVARDIFTAAGDDLLDLMGNLCTLCPLKRCDASTALK